MTFYVARCYQSYFFTKLKSKSKYFPRFAWGPLLSLSSPGSSSPPISQHLPTPLMMRFLKMTVPPDICGQMLQTGILSPMCFLSFCSESTNSSPSGHSRKYCAYGSHHRSRLVQCSCVNVDPRPQQRILDVVEQLTYTF